MKFWRSRRKPTQSPGRSLGLEKLEDRAMLASLSIVSGHVTSFVDADGTQVHVKLSGPGHGTLELVGGVLTGAAIDNLELTGTTGASKLKISTRGGTIKGTTINDLAIEKALGESSALKHLKAKKLYFNDGGSFTADGDVAKIRIRALGNDVNFDVDGSVEKIKTYSLGEDTALDVSGTLQKFVAELLEAGSAISAEQLDMLKIKQQAMGTSIDVGAGGLARAKINYLYNSSIASQGDVGKIVVRGDVMSSALASNINKGSDGIFGTIDDYVVDAAAAGNIAMLKFKGAVGAAGTSQEVRIVTSGTVGTLQLGPQASVENEPFVWEQAASQFIPLSISQAALEATGFEDDEIWVAVFGEQIAIPKTGEIPPKAQAYYLDATQLSGTNPILTSTHDLVPSANTPNLPIIPSSTIAAWANSSQVWGSNLAFPVPPNGSQWTGRIVISAGAPVQAQVNQDEFHSVSAPSAGDPTDPSNGTFYDFLEFTVTNTKAGVKSLDMDTSQVDSFGMPLGLQFFKDPQGQMPFNFEFTGTTHLTKTISGVTNLHQMVLAGLGTGQPITGTGIPAGTLITSYDINASTITLNQAATNSTTVNLTAYAGGIVGVEAARDTILTGTTDDALLQFLQNQVTNGNSQAKEFLQSAAPFRTAGSMQISGASNTSPVTITTYDTTGLANNDWVSVSGVGGNTGANGVYQIAGLTSTSFTLTGSTGTGTYTSGGTWSIAITGSQPDGSNQIQINASNTLGLQNGDLVEVTGVSGETAANGMWFVENVTATSFSLVGSTATGTHTQNAGTWNVYAPGNRLVSPKDIVEGLASPQDLNPLNNYYNEVVDAFFLQYYDGMINSQQGGGQTFSLVSTASGTAITYSGQTKQVTINNPDHSLAYSGYALSLTAETGGDNTVYNIIYPFFTTNSPSPSAYTPLFTPAAPPTWVTSSGWSDQSASQMIFACDAIFADNSVRSTIDMTGTDSAKVLGDLEDSISAAFNRGIVLNDPSTWDQTATWFQQNTSQSTAAGIAPGTYNYWVEYWHQTGLTYKDLAYAFPYDDKFGASTNLDVANVGLAQITLGSWSDTPGITSTTTAYQNFPTSAGPTSTLTLTAQVTGTSPTGTVAFFIDGIPINSQDNSASPPVEYVAVSGGTATITATMPTLPSGAATYTVTAIYSGDASNLPSIAYSPLPIVPQVNVALTDTSGVLGSTTQITSTTPGTTYAGTLTYTISKSDGTNVQTLASNVATTTQINVNSYQVPTNVVTFTGNANGTHTISGINNMTDLMTGQVIAGAGVPTGTTISGLGANSITLNHAVPAGTGIAFTSNGAGATLPISVSFTPTGEMTPSASGSTNLTVTAAPYSFTIAPGSGALGSTPALTVTLPGPPYDGTIEFKISRPDGSIVQDMGTVNVNSDTLSGGNQVVVNDIAIPNDLLRFIGYADGSQTIHGISTVSGIVPTSQSISGGGVTADTITGFTPPALRLTNPAAETSTEPVVLIADGVYIYGITTKGQHAVEVSSVSAWTPSTTLDGKSITDIYNDHYVGTGNTVENFTPGTMTVQHVVPTSNGLPVTFTSTANAAAYPITATWTPTTGGPLVSTPQMFAVT